MENQYPCTMRPQCSGGLDYIWERRCVLCMGEYGPQILRHGAGSRVPTTQRTQLLTHTRPPAACSERPDTHQTLLRDPTVRIARPFQELSQAGPAAASHRVRTGLLQVGTHLKAGARQVSNRGTRQKPYSHWCRIRSVTQRPMNAQIKPEIAHTCQTRVLFTLGEESRVAPKHTALKLNGGSMHLSRTGSVWRNCSEQEPWSENAAHLSCNPLNTTHFQDNFPFQN